MKKPLPLLPLSASHQLRAGLVAGAMGLSALVFTSTAHADWEPRFGAQAYVGYTFGEASGVAWGLEGFVDMANGTFWCGSGPEKLIGSVLRVGFVNSGQPRIVVAGRGGVYFTEGFSSAAGEAGIVYRLGDAPGVGLHLGARAQVPIFGAAISTAIGLDEVTAVATVGAGTNISSGCMVEGRPLRYGNTIAELPALEVHPTDSPCDEYDNNRAAEIWQERARTEWASVPAFTQLAEQLAVSGAPSQLVARAYKAARDEYQHAVLAAGMSARLSGSELELGHPETAHRLPAGGEAGLVRLAVESWVDGCLGEGTAARMAHVESSQSDAPILQRTLLEISSDERAHAELAWDVMAWTLRAGGRVVAKALDATREGSHSEPKNTIPSGLESLGCGSTAQLSQLALEERQHCLERRDTMVRALG